MNKTAIKNFAIWARNKLIADITYKAGLLGISEKGIKSPLPQSTQSVQFFDIGTKEPSSITGIEIQQRKKLVEEIERKANQSSYATAYKNVIEEVAYTWFNRLIAIRFMEVNDYLPTRIRVLSSESNGKAEPDLVTHALEVNLNYTAFEKDRIIQLKHENKLDELFRMLFIKQCNALNTNLPELFEKTSDYSELLLNVSFTDKEGVIYHLVNDIDEDDFDITKEGQVEIIGWMYQYYNTEPKQAVFDGLKKNLKITKEKIPAATQLFTPDWIVRYMVENSLGRLWLESHPNDELKAHWTYYVDEAEQTPEVYEKLRVVRSQSSVKSPEDILLIDPCMGSGHILVYAFDVLMNIYEKEGYNPRDASKIIIEKNIYGLDIDRRAYQLTYFSLMMKARQYNRRIFIEGVKPQVYYPAGWSDGEEYGSLVKIDVLPPKPIEKSGQMGFEDINYDLQLDSWNFKRLLAQKYDVVVTNPPYMGSGSMSAKLSEFVKKNYPDSKKDLSTVFMEKTISLCKSYGFMSMINIPVWMFLPSYEKLRNNLLNRNTYINLIHPGRGIFGSDFGTTAFVIGKKHISGYKGSYRRLFDKQGEVESNEVREYQFLSGKGAYVPQQEIFSKIPGAPVAYWVSPKALSAYNKGKLMSVVGQSTKGIITGDNDRFMRLWWEIQTERINFTAVSDDDAASSRMKWFPCTKGGSFRKWYGNKEYIMDWENRGYRILNEAKFERRNSQDYYNHLKFKQGISWSVLTASTRSFRIENRNLIEHVGMAIFPHKTDQIMQVLGFMNSSVSAYFLTFLSPTVAVNAGEIGRLPFICPALEIDKIDARVKECIQLSASDWDAFETSWDFNKHPLLCGERTVASSFAKWKKETEERFDTLKANEEELNSIFINIYSLQDELTPEVADKDVTIRKADLQRDIKSLISYAVGIMFGRYSLDTEGLAYSGGGWNEFKYSSFLPDKSNILPICDEDYFDNDIVGRFVDFVCVAFGAETLDENIKYISDALGGKGTPREVIRDYFLNEFYKDHCKIYQKRPIYWMFESGKKNGFKALIYLQRYDENTIGNLRIDYLHRMQRIYENELARMQDTIENSKEAREVNAASKRKEKLINQLQETKEYDEKIAHLALARTSIDLDDGVKVNYEKVQTDRDGKKLDVLAKI